MSKIQAIPFIQAVLVTFTPEQQATLVSLINGSNKQPAFRSLINPNHMITTSDKGVNHVTLETKDRVFTGYLLYNNSYCVLLAYAKDTQNLVMVDIDLEAQDYRTVEESLTILELRFSLEDAKEPTDIVGTVQSAIDSGAIDVKAIENIENTGVSDGTVVKMIGFDSEGNLVEGVVSEGQVVDQALDSTSTNAVGNAPVTTAIEGLQSDVSDIETALDTKADTSALENGEIVPNKALQAKSIEAVSTESGAVQDTPFIYQGTGTANGTSIADTSPVGKHLEKQGNSVVVNQLARELTSTYWYAHGNVTAEFANGVATATITSLGTYALQNRIGAKDGYNTSCVSGHKYLCVFDFYALHNGQCGFMLNSPTSAEFYATASTGWNHIVGVVTCRYTGDHKLLIGFETQNAGYSVGDSVQFKNVLLIDLTQWFAGNIPQDILDHPENFFRYYNGSLAYNAGSLENSDGRYLTCGGRNVWDGTHDFNAIPNATYYCYGTSVIITYKDADGNTISTDTKTNETFVAPSNCLTIGISGSGDICISLYYETGDSYDQYFPYEEPKVYDTGSEVLRSAGSVRDVKAPNGTITRKIFVIEDAGQANWSASPSYAGYEMATNAYASQIKGAGDTEVANVLCARYERKTATQTYFGQIGISVDDGGRIRIADPNYNSSDSPSAFKTSMSGVKIYVELKTPTTEQGTPFAENIEINDYGTMGWDSEVPQGCKIFYPADYALFIDSLGEKFNWDVDDIVSQTELTAVNNKIGAKLPECPTDTDGTYVLKAVVADGEVTYTWVAEE